MTTSDRLKMPFLAVAQAQKDVTHNEALAVLDIAVQPVVQSIAPAILPVDPVAGQCWIVGTAPTAAWAGQPGALAAWTTGGWRFVAPFEGMTIWSIGDGLTARRVGDSWVLGHVTAAALVIEGQQVVGPRQPAIAVPTAGNTVDIQARAAVAAILQTLNSHGLIS